MVKQQQRFTLGGVNDTGIIDVLFLSVLEKKIWLEFSKELNAENVLI